MYESTYYKQHSLKEVVVRVDFAAPVDDLAGKMPAELANEAIKRYPIGEPRTRLRREIQVSGGRTTHTAQPFSEWIYWGREREKRLVITPTSLFAVFARYPKYEELKNDFQAILEAMRKAYPAVRGSRTGRQGAWLDNSPLELPQL